MADSQVPGVAALSGTMGEPAWKSKPSWYLLATDAKMIPPDAQRLMAKRAALGGTRGLEKPAIAVPQPQAVASLIEKAAKASRWSPRGKKAPSSSTS